MKTPELKAPQFLDDLYKDLRDRRLLPLIALLVAAIVAAPFLLRDPQAELTPTQGQTGIALPSGKSPSTLLVVADTSGVRSYKKRLKGLQKKNPFAEHFTAPKVGSDSLAATELNGGPSTTTTTTTSPVPDSGGSTGITDTITTTTLSSPDPGSGGGTSTKPPKVQVQTKYVSYEINARVGVPGKVRLRKGIPELTMLPNKKHPVALFMGVTDDAKKALFLVSNDVTSVFGDVGCGFGDDTCQLLELEPGFPVQFTLGDNKTRYQIAVTKITKIVRGT